MANWRKEVSKRQDTSKSTIQASTHLKTSSGPDDIDEADVPGVFDQDEDEAVVSAARESKSAVRISHHVGSAGKQPGQKGRHTSQVRVCLL